MQSENTNRLVKFCSEGERVSSQWRLQLAVGHATRSLGQTLTVLLSGTILTGVYIIQLSVEPLMTPRETVTSFMILRFGR